MFRWGLAQPSLSCDLHSFIDFARTHFSHWEIDKTLERESSPGRWEPISKEHAAPLP